MQQQDTAAPSRLRNAALTSLGEEGRAELVAAKITRAITAGAFIEGERLPSEQEFSAMLGVSLVTVREALGTLRSTGQIITRRGRGGGSFVHTSRGAVEEINAKQLVATSRIALTDLATHYEVIVAACAEYACGRATTDEVDAVQAMLAAARELPHDQWRRRITEVQLELAALSQSVRLTSEHVRLQTEFTPFLALQDRDEKARLKTHDSLVAQTEATRAGDATAAREIVRQSILASRAWLLDFRNTLLKDTSDSGIKQALLLRGTPGKES